MKKRLLCLAMSTLILTFGFAAIAGANKENKSTLTAEERLNQIIKDDGMVYGVLVAWNGDMGHGSDIGGTYRNNYRSGFSEEKWLEKLWNCKAMGFNMVKLWLSEAMEGMVSGIIIRSTLTVAITQKCMCSGQMEQVKLISTISMFLKRNKLEVK